jgi:hypothetical protein
MPSLLMQLALARIVLIKHRWTALVSILLITLLFVANLRTRVFSDCWWIVEWGRLFFSPHSKESMHLLELGKSTIALPWFGSVLSFWTFELSGRRFLGPLSLELFGLLLFGIGLTMLMRNVRQSLTSKILVLVISLTPALTLSISYGRTDALALGLFTIGIASGNALRERLSKGERGWQMGCCYAVACLAPLVWPSASILFFLGLFEVTKSFLIARRLETSRFTISCQILLPSLLVGFAAIVPFLLNGPPDLWAFSSQAVPRSEILKTLYVTLLLAPLSTPIFFLATCAAFTVRENWMLAVVSFLAIIFASGYSITEVRLIYFLPYAALLIAGMLNAAEKPFLLRAVLSLILVGNFGVLLARYYFSSNVSADHLDTALTELRGEYGQTGQGFSVVDFTWDFYPAAARQSVAISRPSGMLKPAQIVALLVALQPTIIINAGRDEWVFSGASQWSPLLAAAGYCLKPQLILDNSTPYAGWLAKIGSSPGYGPYAIWYPCGAKSQNVKEEA